MARQSKKRAYEDAKDRALSEGICVGDIVKVLKFDPAKMTVDVMPVVKYQDEEKFQSCTPILSVPVAPVFGGGFFIRPWYKSGDLGVVFYFDRDSDAVLANGAEADPNTDRLHSGDDAVFIGGIIAGGKTAPGYPSDALVMGTEDGQTYIAITKQGIKIKGDIDIEGNTTQKGNITQTGNTQKTGSVNITGNIGATGDIMAAGSSDNHHGH